MTRTKFLSGFLKLSVGVLLAVAIPFGVESVQAQSRLPSDQRLSPNWGNYRPPSNLDKPGEREGGGSRGPCIAETSPTIHKTIALVPVNGFGTTLAARPTFFVYVPTINPGETPQMQFVLTTADNRLVYRTTFSTIPSPGIVSFSLPDRANSPILELGKTYKWTVTLVCNPNDDDRSDSQLAAGSIQRIAPPSRMASELARTTSLQDKVAVYAKYGIWYDALGAIASLRRTADNPALQNDWLALLTSVELQKIANQPLIQPLSARETQSRPVSRP
ncbi:DUF928 domain-containing protein [Microseira sp. BLCC-F43]|uniref:DUF928 domain-containing protein n=1 Tax=Microseira sp. BLCC-F43 TaxID=3153602 RepID=UPI0035B968ED